MSEQKLETVLYTLCLGGTPTAVCAFERGSLEKDPEQTISLAFVETWRFAGGDPHQLIGRDTMARPPTKREGKMWRDANDVFGKPFLVLGGCDDARGAA
jgi:hypothetical protein